MQHALRHTSARLSTLLTQFTEKNQNTDLKLNTQNMSRQSFPLFFFPLIFFGQWFFFRLFFVML